MLLLVVLFVMMLVVLVVFAVVAVLLAATSFFSWNRTERVATLPDDLAISTAEDDKETDDDGEGDVEDEELARKLARTRGLQTSETAGSLERNLTLFTVQ